MAGTVGKFGQKILQSALVGYTGYEIGKSNDHSYVQPNITVTIPSLGEHRTGVNDWTIVLIGIILALIVLIVLKSAISRYIKNSIQSRFIENSIQLQPIDRARPGAVQGRGQVRVDPA